MQVSSATETNYSLSATTKESAQTLDKNAFLQLLVAQLKNQDPLNPQSSEDFVGQMVQFATIEQLSNLVIGLNHLEATSLVGKLVTVKGDDGTLSSGTVDKVSFVNGEVGLYIGGSVYSLTQVKEVQ